MHLESKSEEYLFTYSRGAYTNFLHEERKMCRLFFARSAYSTHFTRRLKKKQFLEVRLWALESGANTNNFPQGLWKSCISHLEAIRAIDAHNLLDSLHSDSKSPAGVNSLLYTLYA